MWVSFPKVGVFRTDKTIFLGLIEKKQVYNNHPKMYVKSSLYTGDMILMQKVFMSSTCTKERGYDESLTPCSNRLVSNFSLLYTKWSDYSSM